MVDMILASVKSSSRDRTTGRSEHETEVRDWAVCDRDSREHKRNVEIIAECVGGKRGLEKRRTRGDRLNMAQGSQRGSVSTTSVCSPVVG